SVNGAADQKASRHFDAELVAGNLLLNEPIVWLVFVECVNDIVAVGPGVRPGLIRFESVALGKPDNVEPVTRPALAEVRARQITLDQLLVSERIRVAYERFCFLGRRRQAKQVEFQAANERRAICLGRRRQVFLFETTQNESINPVAWPG